jgi:hypothetical protein
LLKYESWSYLFRDQTGELSAVKVIGLRSRQTEVCFEPISPPYLPIYQRNKYKFKMKYFNDLTLGITKRKLQESRKNTFKNFNSFGVRFNEEDFYPLAPKWASEE